MAEVEEIRERFRILSPTVPFSRNIDIKPVERWEPLASTSGWDSAHNDPLSVLDPPFSMTVFAPLILGDILGPRYLYHKDVFTSYPSGDMGLETMECSLGLIQVSVMAYVHECSDKEQVNVQENATRYDRAEAVVAFRLDSGLVAIWLQESKAGPERFTKAFIFVYDDETGPFTELGRETARGMCLDDTVKIVYFNVPRPQENASGIHFLCHIMAVCKLGHHWVDDLTDNNITDVRPLWYSLLVPLMQGRARIMVTIVRVPCTRGSRLFVRRV